jgi:MFS family permease
MPMILGLAGSSLIVGRFITRTGRWKRYLVGGTITATVGFALLGTLDARTGFGLVALYMALVGIGLGATMQNLVLCVQNTVPISDLGAATATVSFFRSLGGAIGVSAMGAVLAHHVSHDVLRGLRHLGISSAQLGSSGTTIPDVATLPHPIAAVVESAYANGVAQIFLLASPLLALAVVTVLFIREVPLRSSRDDDVQREMEQGGAAGAAQGAAVVELAPSGR